MKFRIGLVALALGTMGVAAAWADTTLRVPTSVPEGSPFYVNFLERFANNVKTLTDGSVTVQPFGAGVLMPALQVYEGVQNGVTEAGLSTPSYLVNKDPTNAIFAGFPGGMGPEAYSTWIFEGGGREALSELRESEGLKSLVVGLGSTEILAHSNKELRTAEDLKGVKYRTSGPWAEVMKDYFGAVPTVVPPGETYTLLQRKGVDAVEWAPPSANMPEGFHNAAKYIVVPGVHQPTFLWELVMKLDTWNQFTPEEQAKIEAAAELTAFQSLTHFYAEDIKAMRELRSGRNEIITLDPAVQKQLSDAGRDWVRKTAEAEKAAGKPQMSKVLDNYLAFDEAFRAESGYLVR